MSTNNLPILGLTMRAVTRTPCAGGGDCLLFESTCGRSFRMSHHQDCCEFVDIEDICGDLDWLVGSPITQAEETSRDGSGEEDLERATWTFYRIGTAKGLVVIRWLGTSNGCYSESVDFDEVVS